MNDTSIYVAVEEAISTLLTKTSSGRGGQANFSGVGDRDTASALADMGWSKLTVAQDDGGLGLTLAGLGATMMRLGQQLVPGIWSEQVVLNALVPQIGGRVAVIAHDQACTNLSGDSSPTLAASGVSGTVSLVAVDDSIEHFLVAAEVIDEPTADLTLVLIGRDAPGLHLTRLQTDDPIHPLAMLRLEDVPLADIEVVAAGEEADQLLRRILAWMAVYSACELSGIARRVTTESLAYVKQREQFGKPVGSFQAVKHMLAEMTTATETLEALCTAALEDYDDGHDVHDEELRAWILKAHASEAATRVCESGLQVHGGIGFTAEYGLHWFLRRCYFLATWYGGPVDLVGRIGRRRLESP